MLMARRRALLVQFKEDKRKFPVTGNTDVKQLTEDLINLFIEPDKVNGFKEDGVFRLRR